jgi:acetyl-CoA acetyltransferase
MAAITGRVATQESEVGLVTMCCGGGLGTGTMLQRV